MSTPKNNTDPQALWRAGAQLGIDHVDVMIRDADFALVMWEVTAQSAADHREQIERDWPQARLVLRVRSQTCDRHPTVRTMDIPIERWLGARYVPLGTPGARHTVTLGLKGPKRDTLGDVFVAIARSAPVQPPRARPVRTNTDPQWADAPTAERPS